MAEKESDPHLFVFDLDRAIRAQLIAKLRGSPSMSLAKSIGPQESGVYALFWKDELVYVGKATKEMTKSKRDLRTRLYEHVGKISGRRNIELTNMTVKFLTFESEWWVFAAEFALVAQFKPEWNLSGFGSKVPGVGRPGTHRVSPWDKRFPKR